MHLTYDFQARRLYEKTGYELVGQVKDFPTGTDVHWFRKSLQTATPGEEAGVLSP